MHRFTQLTLTSLVCASAAFSTFNTCADIVISGTRVIYPQSAKDVTVKMENRGTKPLLVQSWLDDGRDTVNPQELKLPFIVTPPVSRIDPSKGQTVRITWTQQPLAQDRESLFWFNVLEVPPKAKDGDSQNVLQLAFRTRIKMFFARMVCREIRLLPPVILNGLSKAPRSLPIIAALIMCQWLKRPLPSTVKK